MSGAALGSFLAVMRREYLQRVRSKWFLFATVAGPLLMGVLIFETESKPAGLSMAIRSSSMKRVVNAASRSDRTTSVGGCPNSTRSPTSSRWSWRVTASPLTRTQRSRSRAFSVFTRHRRSIYPRGV